MKGHHRGTCPAAWVPRSLLAFGLPSCPLAGRGWIRSTACPQFTSASIYSAALPQAVGLYPDKAPAHCPLSHTKCTHSSSPGTSQDKPGPLHFLPARSRALLFLFSVPQNFLSLSISFSKWLFAFRSEFKGRQST